MQRFFKDKKYAYIGSVLYSFSGFQAINLLFFHFHNIVAFFPLLLIGLEEKMVNKKRGWLALFVFLNSFLNYYFFISEVIFLLVYYLVRFTKNNTIKSFLQNTFSCLIEGFIGILMSAMIFSPSIMAIMQNPRSGKYTEFSILMSNREYLQIIRAFLFPGEIMPRQSSIYEIDFSSLSAYLPLVGICLVLSYLFKKKKDWLSVLIYSCLLFAFIPVLNNSFSLFTSSYHRWYYMLILVFSLASALALEGYNEFPNKLSAFLTILFTVLFIIFLVIWNKLKYPTIFYQKQFSLISFISILGLLIILIIHIVLGRKKENKFYVTTLLFISLFSIITSSYTLNEYKIYREVDASTYISKLNAIRSYKPLAGYRVITNDDDLTDMIRNINMTASLPGINTFCSSVHPSIMEFYQSLGLERTIFTPRLPYGLAELLSEKYYITEEKKIITPLQTLSNHNAVYYVYENKKALPIGITYDTCLLQSEFNNLPAVFRASTMIQNLIIKDMDESKITSYLTHTDKYALSNDSIEEIDFLLKQHKEVSSSFTINQTSFESDIQSDAKKYAFFSVPYDEFWRATVNNKQVEILSVNGLMAIPIEKGLNHIIFEYYDKYFLYGIRLSLLGIVCLILYICDPFFYNFRRFKK